MGTIAGSGNANLSNLYSNAILVSSANSVAGFVGRSTKDITITNCWFDGKVIGGTTGRYLGGIVATTVRGTCNFENVLFHKSPLAMNLVNLFIIITKNWKLPKCPSMDE